MKGIALLPGAFKPPTKGHFKAIKELATNTFIEATIKTSSEGKKSIAPKNETKKEVSKVIVLIGSQPRKGISAELSEEIWKIYSKHLPENVEIINTKGDPVKYAKDKLVKENAKQIYFPVVGLRDDRDIKDANRLFAYDKYDNAIGLKMYEEGTGTRATNLREAVIKGKTYIARKLMPDELTEQEFKQVMKLLRGSIEGMIEEEMHYDMDSVLDRHFTNGKEVKKKKKTQKENLGTAIKIPKSISSEDRMELINLYKKLKPQIDQDKYQVHFQQDRITITQRHGGAGKYDYVPALASVTEYLLEQKLGIRPLPEVILQENEQDANDFFGKTAFYDPVEKSITLQILNRHPKDVTRSFVHEMIHHMQNLEGRLNNIGTTNINEDEYLQEIESEAYLKGNMLFRSWEDTIK